MARLEQLSLQVLAVMNDIGQNYANYQKVSGLTCRSGCGECCQHPGIEATVLEMLPLAFRLIDEQRADQVLAELADRDDARCYFYQSHSEDRKQGQCGVYQQRPGICRFFGASGTTGRAGEIQLSTCRNIKTDHAITYAATLIALESDPPPLIRHGQEQIRQLDPELANKSMPLNQALAAALEKALFEQYYQSAAFAVTDSGVADTAPDLQLNTIADMLVTDAATDIQLNTVIDVFSAGAAADLQLNTIIDILVADALPSMEQTV